MLTHSHGCMHACIHTYLHTACTRTYIHTNTHTYTLTCTAYVMPPQEYPEIGVLGQAFGSNGDVQSAGDVMMTSLSVLSLSVLSLSVLSLSVLSLSVLSLSVQHSSSVQLQSHYRVITEQLTNHSPQQHLFKWFCAHPLGHYKVIRSCSNKQQRSARLMSITVTHRPL